MPYTVKRRELTKTQLAALPHLLTADTVLVRCRNAKISPQTYYHWLQEPAFKRKMAELRKDLVDEAEARLKSCFEFAVETLIDILVKSKDLKLKHAVANNIIGYVIRLKEIEKTHDQTQTQFTTITVSRTPDREVQPIPSDARVLEAPKPAKAD